VWRGGYSNDPDISLECILLLSRGDLLGSVAVLRTPGTRKRNRIQGFKPAQSMSEWTGAYLDVGYRARQFAWASELLRLKMLRNYYIYAYDLAIARANLEMALACYKVTARQQIG
jgi:hypothetical protein